MRRLVVNADVERRTFKSNAWQRAAPGSGGRQHNRGGSCNFGFLFPRCSDMEIENFCLASRGLASDAECLSAC